eukprot:TRINITY_DN23136_c0_g1_i1.p1 TRINITY_DN23136_c0_g1~~TRINITY_DN23136_c0_g1_i1.p1  ORF type:complete len:147 (-),score=44.27 TRINITY_DN23136_c0_g1_i1:101-541(-)
MLKRRIDFLEDDLKATLAAATAAKQQRAIASARPPLGSGTAGDYSHLNSTHLLGGGGGASPYHPSSYTPSHHQHGGAGVGSSPSPMPVLVGGDHFKSPMVAPPATSTTTTTRSPSAMTSAAASRLGMGGTGPVSYTHLTLPTKRIV